jgi:hypothetical protein
LAARVQSGFDRGGDLACAVSCPRFCGVSDKTRSASLSGAGVILGLQRAEPSSAIPAPQSL